jgi:ABC-type transport system involved in multi-copper enzyme maturation permease subunit
VIALIRADMLKLVRRRGLMIAAIVIVIGLPVIVVAVRAIGRAANPDVFDAYGGGDGYDVILGVLGFGLFVTTILLGAVAGSTDESRGVFRDLVATGVSRPRLALARIPAVIAVIIPFALLTYLLALTVGSAISGTGSMPAVGDLLRDGGDLVVAIGIYAAIAVGLSSLTGSLSVSLTVLFMWFLIIEPILMNLSVLGDARRFLLSPAQTAITRPSGRIEGQEVFGLSVAAGALILAAWLVVFVASGVWRVSRRDA